MSTLLIFYFYRIPHWALFIDMVARQDHGSCRPLVERERFTYFSGVAVWLPIVGRGLKVPDTYKMKFVTTAQQSAAPIVH